MLLSTCTCCVAPESIERRTVLRGLGAGALIAALPGSALAAYKFDAMILSCIDPRFVTPVKRYANGRGLKNKYSKFNIAGASIGVVAPKFQKWHKAFWDNLGASVKLHSIASVIAIDHRDCGAARIAYGKEATATPELETETHRKALAEFRKQVAERQPQLKVETYLMARNGTVEALG